MDRLHLPIILAVTLLLVAVPAQATAVTETLPINWVKAYPTGVLFSLDGFNLVDVDPAICASPGSPYFWLPVSSPNYETLVATLLTAHASDRMVKIRYQGCSTHSTSSPMLDVWMLHVS